MNSDKLWVKLLSILGILYLIFVVGKTVYQNYQIQQQIRGLKSEIDDLGQSNKDLAAQILYYQSSSYQERIARERLGLQKPGEKVIVILPEAKAKETKEDPYKNLSNPERWWNFFFNS